MNTVETLLAEMEAARQRLVAPWEGFKDYSRALDNKDGSEAVTFVSDAVRLYAQRDASLATSIDALTSLMSLGYPMDIAFKPSDTVRQVLQENLSTVSSAFSTLGSVGEAASAAVNIGPVTPI